MSRPVRVGTTVEKDIADQLDADGAALFSRHDLASAIALVSRDGTWESLPEHGGGRRLTVEGITVGAFHLFVTADELIPDLTRSLGMPLTSGPRASRNRLTEQDATTPAGAECDALIVNVGASPVGVQGGVHGEVDLHDAVSDSGFVDGLGALSLFAVSGPQVERPLMARTDEPPVEDVSVDEFAFAVHADVGERKGTSLVPQQHQLADVGVDLQFAALAELANSHGRDPTLRPFAGAHWLPSAASSHRASSRFPARESWSMLFWSGSQTIVTEPDT